MAIPWLGKTASGGASFQRQGMCCFLGLHHGQGAVVRHGKKSRGLADVATRFTAVSEYQDTPITSSSFGLVWQT